MLRTAQPMRSSGRGRCPPGCCVPFCRILPARRVLYSDTRAPTRSRAHETFNLIDSLGTNSWLGAVEIVAVAQIMPTRWHASASGDAEALPVQCLCESEGVRCTLPSDTRFDALGTRGSIVCSLCQQDCMSIADKAYICGPLAACLVLGVHL